MDRAALVTGGSSGIGLAIARMLRDEGYELTLASRRAERVQAAAEELGALAVAVDVGSAEDCARLVAEHQERYGRLDVLVNSAGTGVGGAVEDLPAKHFDLQIGVNLRGLFLVTQAAIPLLRETRGWIVNLASIAGTLPAIDARFTIQPRVSRRSGIAACVTRKSPRRLTPICRSKCLAGRSSTAPPTPVPAELTSTSSRP